LNSGIRETAEALPYFAKYIFHEEPLPLSMVHPSQGGKFATDEAASPLGLCTRLYF